MQLVYDCETTGLPLFKEPSDHPGQPYIAQLAAVLRDDQGMQIAVMDRLVKPDGWVMGAEAAQLTGITQERLEDEGLPITEVLDEFFGMFGRASAGVLAFNESFDARMVRIMLKRLKLEQRELAWEKRVSSCAMLRSTAHCKLPPTPKMLKAGFNKPKSPKLAEAYKILIGEEMEGAHDALHDVMATIQVHDALVKLGL